MPVATYLATDLTHLPLRERKKLRTRHALIEVALFRFTEQGFDATTIDELCQAVEISKTTFFRYFSCKEEVALAPTDDLWNTFMDELGSRPVTGATLPAFLQDTLIAALDRMPDHGWADSVLASRRLAARFTIIDAHGLRFCRDTTEAALRVIHRRFGTDPELPAQLAMDILVAAFHRAVDSWTGRRRGHTKPNLVTLLRESFAAVPASLSIEIRPDAAGGTP